MTCRTGVKTDQDRNDSLVPLLHQVTDDLVIKVLNWLPLQGNIGGEKKGEGERGRGKRKKGEKGKEGGEGREEEGEGEEEEGKNRKRRKDGGEKRERGDEKLDLHK